MSRVFDGTNDRLGNAAGKPNDPESQAATLELALRVLETAPGPRTTVQSTQRWSASHEWKLDYMNVERVAPEEIARLREESQRARATGKAVREATGVHTGESRRPAIGE